VAQIVMSKSWKKVLLNQKCRQPFCSNKRTDILGQSLRHFCLSWIT